MRVVEVMCAWCGFVLETRTDHTDPRDELVTSHGICETCMKEQLEEVEVHKEVPLPKRV